MTVRTFLDVSTGHLMPATRKHMDNGDYPSLSMTGEYGWLCYVSMDLGASEVWKADMIDCMNKAYELKCDYILFDRDATAREDLKWYDD